MKYWILLVLVFSLKIGLKAHHGLEGSVGMNGSCNTGFTTLKKGQFYFELTQFTWLYESMNLEWYSIPNVLNMKNAQSFNFQGMYGITNKFTAGFQSMYNSASFTPLFGTVENYEEESFNGLGDVNLFLIHRLYKKNGFELAGLLGSELPIGVTGAQNGAVLTTAGSRSLDPMAGLILNQKFDHFKFRNQTIYKLTTENQDGYDFGDIFSNEFFLEYSFKEDHHDDTTGHKTKDIQLSLLTALKYEYLAQNSRNGSSILNTGHNRSFITGGIRLSYKDKFFIPITVDIPLVESWTGIQNASSVRFQGGISLLIN